VTTHCTPPASANLTVLKDGAQCLTNPTFGSKVYTCDLEILGDPNRERCIAPENKKCTYTVKVGKKKSIAGTKTGVCKYTAEGVLCNKPTPSAAVLAANAKKQARKKLILESKSKKKAGLR
jgi:hypothetical protein